MAEDNSFWEALLNATKAGAAGGNPLQAATPNVHPRELVSQPSVLDRAVFDGAPAVNTPQRAQTQVAQPPQAQLPKPMDSSFNSLGVPRLQGSAPTALQQDQAEQLRALVEQQNAPISEFRDVDLGPLAALVDNATGSKLSPSISGNVNVEKRRKEIDALRKSLAGGKAQSSQDRRDARFLHSQGLRGNNNMRKDKNRLIDSLSKVKGSFANLEDALDAGDFVRLQNSLSNYARVISGEKGVLTDRDIVRVLPNNMRLTLAKAESYVSKHGTTDIPQDMLMALRSGITDARKNLVNVSQDQMDNLLSDAEHIGATKEFADKMRRDGRKFITGVGDRKPRAKPSKPKKLSRLEELRAKKAAR